MKPPVVKPFVKMGNRWVPFWLIGEVTAVGSVRHGNTSTIVDCPVTEVYLSEPRYAPGIQLEQVTVDEVAQAVAEAAGLS